MHKCISSNYLKKDSKPYNNNMELIPIGTSSASVMRSRGLSAFVLRCNENLFLFDCGDGTQFRLLEAGLRRSRIRAVFISHLHGDHYLGLLGLLTSMSLERRETPLTIISPKRLVGILKALPGLCPEEIHLQIRHVSLEEDIEWKQVYHEFGIQVCAHPLDHGRFCVGYRVEETGSLGRIDGALARTLGIRKPEHFQKLAAGKTVQMPDGQIIRPDQVKRTSGAVFAYVTDTRPCEAGLELAKNADLLVHEATFSESDKERAATTGHSTAWDAARLAKTAGAKKLLLTHMSSRYPDPSTLSREAKELFPSAEIAQEYQVYPILSEGQKPQTESAA